MASFCVQGFLSLNFCPFFFLAFILQQSSVSKLWCTSSYRVPVTPRLYAVCSTCVIDQQTKHISSPRDFHSDPVLSWPFPHTLCLPHSVSSHHGVNTVHLWRPSRLVNKSVQKCWGSVVYAFVSFVTPVFPSWYLAVKWLIDWLCGQTVREMWLIFRNKLLIPFAFEKAEMLYSRWK